jgi:hypothetical protein
VRNIAETGCANANAREIDKLPLVVVQGMADDLDILGRISMGGAKWRG